MKILQIGLIQTIQRGNISQANRFYAFSSLSVMVSICLRTSFVLVAEIWTHRPGFCRTSDPGKPCFLFGSRSSTSKPADNGDHFRFKSLPAGPNILILDTIQPYDREMLVSCSCRLACRKKMIEWVSFMSISASNFSGIFCFFFRGVPPDTARSPPLPGDKLIFKHWFQERDGLRLFQ